MMALFRTFEQSLSGWPDTILSVSLVASGIAVILVGLIAPRSVKLLYWLGYGSRRLGFRCLVMMT
jgi:hypothetical protein